MGVSSINFFFVVVVNFISAGRWNNSFFRRVIKLNNKFKKKLISLMIVNEERVVGTCGIFDVFFVFVRANVLR